MVRGSYVASGILLEDKVLSTYRDKGSRGGGGGGGSAFSV